MTKIVKIRFDVNHYITVYHGECPICGGLLAIERNYKMDFENKYSIGWDENFCRCCSYMEKLEPQKYPLNY